MSKNQISGQGYEGIMFLNYKEELVVESNKLRNEGNVNAVVLLSHIGIWCGNGNNLTLNMYKPQQMYKNLAIKVQIFIPLLIQKMKEW